MRTLLVLLTAATMFSCNQSRNDKDLSAYDVITEKSYVFRVHETKPDDSLSRAITNRQVEMKDYLDRHGFTAHVTTSDSLLFRRTNGQEVIIELPEAEDEWQARTIIAFDPMKNPLFINLHKDTTQVEHYIH